MIIQEEEAKFLNENPPFEKCPTCLKAVWKIAPDKPRFHWECQNCSNEHVGVFWSETYLRGYWHGYRAGKAEK